MKTKIYSNVFTEAAKHPKAKPYLEESKARIKLAEALHKERISQDLTMTDLVGYIVGLGIVVFSLFAAFGWYHYRYTDCIKVGHSETYCFMDLFSN